MDELQSTKGPIGHSLAEETIQDIQMDWEEL